MASSDVLRECREASGMHSSPGVLAVEPGELEDRIRHLPQPVRAGADELHGLFLVRLMSP